MNAVPEMRRMSFSRMAAFDLSPRHYLYELNNPAEPTPAMLFGSAFHCYVLEPDRFNLEYYSGDQPKKPTSAQLNAKKPSPETVAQVEQWNAFLKELNGRTPISPEDLEKIKRMSDAIRKYERANELLMSCTWAERSLEWTDRETGVPMKGKLDAGTDDFTIDLKTCEVAHPDIFARMAYNNGYHKQGALYVDGRPLSGQFDKKGDYYIIAIEKNEPHGVSVLRANRDFISIGRDQYTRTLESYRFWHELGCPDVGYEWRDPFGEFSLAPPRWAV